MCLPDTSITSDVSRTIGKHGLTVLLRGWHRRLAIAAEAPSCRLAAPGGGNVFRYGSQSGARHVSIECLILPRLHQIGLVPDADTAIGADGAVETPPRAQMRIILAAGEALKILK